MKIIFVTENFGNYYSGGRFYAWYMAHALAALDHEVLLVTNSLPSFDHDFNYFPKRNTIRIIVDYNYAQNAYRAQSRTYTDVIVFENDIISIKRNTLKAKLQALYVNCTRAKRRVYIYNKKYRVNQSKLPQSLREELGI